MPLNSVGTCIHLYIVMHRHISLKENLKIYPKRFQKEMKGEEMEGGKEGGEM